MPRNFWIIGNNYNHHICLQVKRENNMERLDMCDAIQTHRVAFILNPLDAWERFPDHLKHIIGRPWKEFKYFVDIDGEGQVNLAIADIPNNEPRPVKRTVKKYKVFPAGGSVLLAASYAARNSSCFSMDVSTPRFRCTLLVL